LNTNRTQRSHIMTTTLLRTDTSADTSSSRANAGTHCFARCSFWRHNFPTQYETRLDHHILHGNRVLINLLSKSYSNLTEPLSLSANHVLTHLCHDSMSVSHYIQCPALFCSWNLWENQLHRALSPSYSSSLGTSPSYSSSLGTVSIIQLFTGHCLHHTALHWARLHHTALHWAWSPSYSSSLGTVSIIQLFTGHGLHHTALHWARLHHTALHWARSPSYSCLELTYSNPTLTVFKSDISTSHLLPERK